MASAETSISREDANVQSSVVGHWSVMSSTAAAKQPHRIRGESRLKNSISGCEAKLSGFKSN